MTGEEVTRIKGLYCRACECFISGPYTAEDYGGECDNCNSVDLVEVVLVTKEDRNFVLVS